MSEYDRNTRDTATKATLNSPDDLVAELPAILGYHPEDSLVVVLAQDRTMRCVVRIDLVELPGIADRIVSIASRAEADTAFAVLYADSSGEELPHRAQVEDLCEELDESSVHLVDVLLVDDGRYWSYLCEDPRCCPPEGRRVRGGTPVLEAERVRSGLPAVAASRSLAASVYRLRPEGHPTESSLHAAELLSACPLESRGRVAVEAVATLSRLLDGGRLGLDPVDDELDETLRAALMVLVQDIHVRDFLLGSLATSSTDLGTAIDVLIRAAVTAPEELRPRVAGTAAALLAADGSNPVALWAMVDLAEDESLAALVKAGVEQGCPPELVRQTFADALPLVRERITAS